MKYARYLIALALGLCLCAGASALADPYAIEPPVAKDYDLPYTLTVYLSNQLVVAYDAGTQEAARYMLCSSGAASTPTKKGTYTMPGSKPASWCWFGTCYVRYPSRIKGSIYFHSVLYSGSSTASLNTVSWNKLGQRASHGCIRMTPVDAQWIAYNCKKGTRVRIVGGSSDHALKVIHDRIRSEVRGKGPSAYNPTLKPTPTPLPPTLQLGSTGARVKSLQTRLRQRGFYPGSLNASFDADTETAWKRYEAARGWAQDGVATTDEQVALADDTDTVAYYCTLTSGFAGPIVKAVETRLKAIGFFTGTPNTAYDAATVKAVKAFQTAGGEAVTGKLTPDQQTSLFSGAAPTPTPAPPLKIGSSGSRVKTLQQRLYTLGFYAGSATGKYQAATAAAVRAYQKAAGLSETGEADGALQAEIRANDARVGSVRKLVLRSKGIVVRVIEEKLRELGYFDYEPDLIYDRKSVAAVKAFQTAMGIAPADGLGSRATIEAILTM